MKTNLFFTCCLLALFGCLIPKTTVAANLLSNGDMSSQGSWSVLLIANTPPENGPGVTWNYTGDKPTSATGGVLRLLKNTDGDQAQITLFQKLNLAAGLTYELDGAVKVSGGLNYWVEVFVDKTAPAADADYGSEDIRIAAINYWSPSGNSNVNGTFKANAGGTKAFTPTEAGEYYVVFKIGCNPNGRYDVLLDDLFFGIPDKPEASFKVNARAGFAPLTVNFTNTSVRATGYEWDFGDGQTSTEANPSHSYANPGNYTVILKAIGSGTNTIEKANFVQVKAFSGAITGGGKLSGGNMQNAAQWSVCYLNSPAGQYPTATWNYTGSVPKAGQGGALRVQGSGSNATVQYCIYQKVTLDASKVYRFNGAFKDLSPDLWHFWTEIFIGDTEPANGSDFGASTGETTLLTSLSNWEDKEGLTRGLDGSYQAHGTVKDFTPTESGEFWFVFKTGVYVPDGQTIDFDILIDELVLEEVRTKPYTNFTAENYQGFAPLEVSFKNTSSFANSYLWDFGDGQTSAEANPNHTYANIGKYTVSLKATNEVGDSTLVKTDFVVVNDRPTLPEGEKLYGGNMETGDSGLWYTATLGAAAPVTLTWGYTDATPTGGKGGALRLISNPGGGKGSNIALYQPITVKKDYMYDFNCLYKAIGSNTNNLWVQVYVTAEKPDNTTACEQYFQEDYTLGQLNTWVDASVTTYDGPMRDKAVRGKFYTGELLSYRHTGAEGAQMYFVIKIGTWELTADIVLDNFSLMESPYAARPKANFSADATYSETAPLTVQFFDESDNSDPDVIGTTYLWNFGDGQTSTERDPSHTYAQVGVYTVSLTVTNGTVSDTKTIANMIRVGISGIDETDYNDCIIHVENGQINVTSGKTIESIAICDVKGLLLEAAAPNAGNYVSGVLAKGIYILKVDSRAYKVAVQ